MNLRRVFVYFPAFAKGYIRNPMGLFFALVFPVILILIFGSVFANTGSVAVPLTVEDLDQNSPASQMFLAALNASDAVQISMVPASVGNLSTYMSNHSLSDGLVIPSGFGQDIANRTPVHVIVYTNPSGGSSSGIVLGAVQGAVNGINLRIAGGSVVVSPTGLHVGSQAYTYIDYLIPGLIAFVILTTPMFSMVDIASNWKRDKLFRQLSLTPLSRSEWLTALLLWYILLTIVSAFLLVGVGSVVFGAHLSISWSVLPFLIIGPVFFVSVGLLAGSVSTTPEAAAVVGNMITFPMMFLSGTFFSVSLFPPFLKTIAHGLPLFYIVDGLSAVMVYNDPMAAQLDLLVILILAVVFFFVATRTVRWQED